MFSQRTVLTLLITAVQIFVLSFVTGCPQTADNNGDNNNSNDGGGASIAAATELTFDSDGKADLTASRIGGNSVSFFKIGDLAAGDRVVVDVRTASGDLDPVAGIFNASEDIIAFNDDRAVDGSSLNPLIDIVLRANDSIFVGVTPFPGAGTSGTFRVIVTITRNVGVPTPTGQTVYFNWAGGNNISIPNVGTFDLTPFTAADVGLASNATAQLKTRVEAIVAERYSGLNIKFLSSDRDPIPTASHSTVHFGGFNRAAFAISEQIDTFNADQADDTIVFTESFNGAFSRLPGLESMAVAIGNTTAHEIGHLLGLIHTKAATDLMDTTGGNDSILVNQEFERAPLDDSVFPTGFQDSFELLTWILGAVGI